MLGNKYPSLSAELRDRLGDRNSEKAIDWPTREAGSQQTTLSLQYTFQEK